MPATTKTDRPLKLLQVHTFYPHYLKCFYQQYPQLARQPVEAQMKALIDDAFSAIHMLAPHLQADPQLAYDAKLVIPNCVQAQAQWLIENKMTPEKNTSMFDVLRWQIDAFGPDIVYFTDPITFDSRFIRSLKKRPRLILGWRASDIPEQIDWSEFDCILSRLEGIRQAAVRLGARGAMHFSPGFPDWIMNAVTDIPPVVDVVFSGQYTLDQHKSRNMFLDAISNAALSSERPFSAEFYLSGRPDKSPPAMITHIRPPVFGLAMHKALRRGRIAFDARCEMRIFEATGTGTFLLTEHFDSLLRDFEIGKEIETYKSKKELLDKIRYYLAHPREREQIARAGQLRCLSDHAMSKRVRDFDGIIRHLLRGNNPGSTDQALRETLAAAESHLENGGFQRALDILSEAKATHPPYLNLDYMRAKAFYSLKQFPACSEALKEELRYFPDNSAAHRMARNIAAQGEKQVVQMANEGEFEKLHKAIAPYTMLSMERLKSLYRLALKICRDNVPGNVVECGVAAGGSSALLAYVLKHHSKIPRQLYAFDTFEGMPRPTMADTHQGVPAEKTGWGTGTCAAPVTSLQQICKTLEVLDFVVPIKGDFCQTLPRQKNQIGPISLLHMDGDWYESTKAILHNLYDHVDNHGIVQIDDYGHWEGCKKAVEEFSTDRNLTFDLRIIDYSGVWFQKSDAVDAPVKTANACHVGERRDIEAKSCPTKAGMTDVRKLLNLGCGNHYHPDWTNVDFIASGPNVMAHDLNSGIPFGDALFDGVYHSHLLEHFPRPRAAAFLAECYRVLKPGGIIRVVVPDLETIVRCYLSILKQALEGDPEAQDRYEWIMLELFDQMVRNFPGGEMITYWQRNPMPAEDFVVQRMGAELTNYLERVRSAPAGPPVKHTASPVDAQTIGRFRLSGEIHQWMYDRYSLGKLLTEAGFHGSNVCRAEESALLNFNTFFLDVLPTGMVRKPDSLYMEADKPIPL